MRNLLKSAQELFVVLKAPLMIAVVGYSLLVVFAIYVS